MAHRKIRTIWQNESVVLSNAGNLFLEVNGGARCSWVPGKNNPYSASPGVDFSNSGNFGTLISGQSPVAAVDLPVDTIRGYPGLRREHLFALPLDTKGNGTGNLRFNRCFFEWRGENKANSTGFALGGAGIPTDIARAYFYSTTRCWAFGSFFEDTESAYATEPFLASWNSANLNKLYGPPAGLNTNNDNRDQEALDVINGMPLMCRPFCISASAGETSVRTHEPPVSLARLPWNGENPVLSRAGLLWGYTARGTGGSAKFPGINDKMSWVFEVGYPKTFTSHTPTFNTGMNPVTELSIAGLSKIWVAFMENAPSVAVTPWWLDFTTASMTVGGRIKMILVDEYGTG